MDPVHITIQGPHDTGRTTMAVLFKMFLEENGYTDVQVKDTESLPVEQKDSFPNRWARNRSRPVRIQIVLVDG